MSFVFQLICTNNNENTASKNTKHAFAKTCSRVLFWQFWSIVPLRLLCSFFFILQPLLIRSVLTYVLNIYDVDTSKHIALGLIGTALCIYGGIAVCTCMTFGFTLFLSTILDISSFCYRRLHTLCHVSPRNTGWGDLQENFGSYISGS